MWANRAWQGSVIAPGRKPAEFIADYAQALNTVEGNTTFYGLPKETTVRAWRDQTPPWFRFCFKFPKQISHVLQLQECRSEVDAFFQRLAPLERRLGPFFLQLPPHFQNISRLAMFLEDLPRDFNFAVEVRHPVFFQGGPLEQDFQSMLRDLNMDRVLFDTVRLMAFPSDDPDVKACQAKKPNVPRSLATTGLHPFLRYVGIPDIHQDSQGIHFWADQVAKWIAEGKKPYVFMHQVPEDDDAPELCRKFHNALQTRLATLPPSPEWPGEKAAREDEGRSRQMSLF